MGAIANKVLSDLGYDTSYRAQGAGVVRQGSAIASPQSPDYLGNVFNSIRSSVGALPGVAQKTAQDWMGHAQTVGKGIAQFAPNVLFGQNSTSKNGQGGGYVPGLANLLLPGASPLFQQQANANSKAQFEGKSTALDDFFATPTAQIADVNKNQNQTMATLRDARKKLDMGQISQDQFNAVVKGTQTRLRGDRESLGQIGSNIVDPKEFNYALADVATTPFAFGKLKGVGAAGSALAKAEKVLGASSKSQSFLPTGIKDVATTLLKAPLKQELINKPNINSAMDIPGQLSEGKYKDAALNAGSFFVPAALAVGGKVAKGASNFIGKNIFDTSGVFDKIKLVSGNTVNQDIKAFAKEAAAVGADNPKLARQATQMENRLRVLQDLLLQESNGNHKLAASKLAEYQSSANQFEKMGLEKFVKEATRHFEARIASQKLAQGGVFGEKWANKAGITVGRLMESDKKTIINRLRQADDMAAEVAKMRKEGLIKNDNLLGQLNDIVASGNKKLALSEIGQITASKPLLANGEAQVFKNGYFATYSKAAGSVKKAEETAKLAAGKEAKFGGIGNVLRKAGISPEQITSEDSLATFNKFKGAFTKSIDGIGDRSGKKLYTQLNKLAENTMGVTDIRQLSKTRIAKELNLSKEEAGKILKSAKDSYKVLSLEERGLAGKLMDFNLRKNPLAPAYSRAQSIARYEKNPFFRLQENVETRLGVSAIGGKQVVPTTGKYDDTIKKLNKSVFTSGYGSEGADGLSGSFSGVGAKISRDQQANIAATVEKFAGSPDKVDSWLRNPKNSDILNDIKTIVQYPDKGFTSSNMAKMLNIVSFPSRYNLKVTGFAVKQLAKQPAMTQIATIRALGDFNDFAKSPEGIKWQADNKEVIGILKYLTPIMPISSVYQTLTGENKTLMDTGMIGGLPFGVITRVLQGQGVLKDRVPYVDPRTGKVFSDKIPEDLKAKSTQFLSDIVDTLYTYPGRTAGMTSKKDVTQGLVENASLGQLKGGKYTEVDRSKDVTPEQQRQINVLKAGQRSSNSTKLSKPLAQLQTTKRPTSIVPTAVYKAKKGKRAKSIAKPISSLL